MSRRFQFSIGRRDRWQLVVYSICLIGAGFNHAHDIWRGGWLPYRYAPLAMNMYWTALTGLDPLAAGLLWWKLRTGLVLTLAIIATDVAVNSVAVYRLGYAGWYAYASLQLQTLFLGVVVGSLPSVWVGRRGSKHCSQAAGAATQPAFGDST